MRQINGIFCHCTATRADWWRTRSTGQKVAEVKRWHVSAPRNWRDIGYHYLIDRNGTVAPGRPVTQTPAAQRGHNTGTIAIALFGGHGSSANDKFADNFTPEQDKALRRVIDELQASYGPLWLKGHNEVDSGKACPGFRVSEWYGEKTAEPPTWEPQHGFWASISAFFAKLFGGKR